MLIVTNFQSFPEEWTASSGERGVSLAAGSVAEFEACRHRPDALFLVNCDPRMTLELAAHKMLQPRPPLVSVDLVLRRPSRLSDTLTHPLKRLLLSRVDLFVHYFRDVRSYDQAFGIGPDRSAYVPFKVNLWDQPGIEPAPEGDYALCFGRSLRDFDTFFSAIETLPYPGAIARPDLDQLLRNAARFTRRLDDLPANVRLLPDDGTAAAQLRILAGAKLLILPIRKASLVASGISTCLNGMFMRKCVIGTDGPGFTDIFTNGEVITVPPEDPPALAAAMQRAWEDDELRRKTAAAGYAYASNAGGENQLYARLIDLLVSWKRAGISGLPESARCSG